MQSKTQANGAHVQARRWTTLLLLCSWACSQAAHAQSPDSSSEGPIRVHGIVVNTVTQAPISRALVTTIDQRLAIMTDDKGRFEFEMRAPASHTSQLRGALGTGAIYYR